MRVSFPQATGCNDQTLQFHDILSACMQLLSHAHHDLSQPSLVMLLCVLEIHMKVFVVLWTTIADKICYLWYLP
jgi:hypothetical protein